MLSSFKKTVTKDDLIEYHSDQNESANSSFLVIHKVGNVDIFVFA